MKVIHLILYNMFKNGRRLENINKKMHMIITHSINIGFKTVTVLGTGEEQ